MEKIIKIRNYENKKFKVKIENFEDVKEISVGVFAGDEVLQIEYTNGKNKIIDASDLAKKPRMIWEDYELYDGGYDISLDKIDEFSNYESSFDGLDANDGWY